MAVSYAEIMYDPAPIVVAPPPQKMRFELEGLHFIIVYMIALFVMTFSTK